MSKFIEWLNDQLYRRGWSASELARRAGLSAATITRVQNTDRDVGAVACNGLSKAFRIPPETVFRMAGLLPQDIDRTQADIREIVYLFDMLDQNEKDVVLIMVRGLVEHKDTHHGQNNG